MTDTKFSMTIENGDRKEQISNTFFEESDSSTLAAGDSKLLLFSAGSNKSDNDRYSFNAAISKFAKGVYTIADIDLNPGFSVTSSAFPNAELVTLKPGRLKSPRTHRARVLSKENFPACALGPITKGTFGEFKINGAFRLRKRLN